MRGLAYAFPVFVLLFAGCDGGLEPKGTSATTGTFTGLITFQNWQVADSVYDMRLIAFRVFPPANIVEEVLQGRAVVHPPLGGQQLASRGEDSLRYELTVAPGTFPYVVIAQQFGPNILADWRPVGQYDLDTNYAEPSPVHVVAGGVTSGIDIRVDFAHPPPPPFQ